ncbi:MAG TPA: tetratricopeptide repeat protein [Candidatus Omnitrophota bacterium]|nr:tetratricopeptide repeat protein [Candidatus Omnitrophota bacterium]HPD84206.1 tetratricopeptide repeat protein [Candidatus Omnitrophota bacterium]HRZ03062.1 tetratricopeptide repeat protein [Candidatus Omnitrophota bacterium]
MNGLTRFLRHFLFCLLTAILGIGIYRGAFRAPFQFDDLLTVVENPSIKSLSDIGWIWFFDPSRFLTHLSFALNYRFAGLETYGYHLVNFGIHLLTAWMVYILLRMIVLPKLKDFSRARAEAIIIFAALIFLCHPIQTAAVTYVAQRSTLLASFFYLSSMIFYIAYRTRGKRSYYLWAILVACVGLFTKPIIITLPLAMVLYEVFFLGLTENPDKKKILKGLMPFFLMIIVVPSLLVLWKYKSFDLNNLLSVTQETAKISRKDYLLTEFNVLMTYLKLLIVPVNQNLDYDFPIAKNFFAFPTYVSFLALLAIFLFALRMYKTQKLFAFAVAWFFLTLSLESSVFPISDVIFEHRLYLPMVGFVIFVSLGLARLIGNRYVYVGAMFFVIAVFSFLTYQRNLLWGDRIAFLNDVAQKSPRKPRVHNNLGFVYHEQGNLRAAEAEYNKAVALDSDYAHPLNNLANIYMAEGRIPEALAALEQALKIDPRYAAPYYNLGNIYRDKGDFKKAKEFYEKGMRINPDLAQFHAGLGFVYLQKGDVDLAESYFQQAISLNPDFGYAYYGLADLYLKTGKHHPALEMYLKAIKLKPDFAPGFNDIGNLYDMQGDYDLAIESYQKAIKLDSRFANAYLNLANSLKKAKRFKESREALMRALEIYNQKRNKAMAEISRKRLQELPE